MKNLRNVRFEPPQQVFPSVEWAHHALWTGVRAALKSLPAYFRSETFIEGISAIDIFTLNSALGATIENQVVDALNAIRSVWDVNGRYGTYVFQRQPQSFPDVVLKNLANENETPLMGIELKGWYLLAKEGEPSLRFTQTEAACADADMIMVVPWALSSVISGRPRIYEPYIESAKYAARYRNLHWRAMRGEGDDAQIVVPAIATPYPKKSDATTDYPKSDRRGNFGRIARTGMMDEYLDLMRKHPVCGIKAAYWLEFFKIFHQDSTDSDIQEALIRLRTKAESVDDSPARRKLLDIILAFETLVETK